MLSTGLNRTIRLLLSVCAAVLFITSARGAEERVLTSLTGVANPPHTAAISLALSGYSIATEDQWYSYMLSHPASGSSPYTDIFKVKSAKTNVVLRYDDSRRYYTDKSWTLTIDYTLVTYDADGTADNTNGAQQLVINYDPREGYSYKDKAVRQYFNSHRAEITITGITYVECPASGPCTTSSTIPSYLADVYLDVEQVTERFYELNVSAVPVMAAGTVANQELPLTWNYIQGAETYDLEWVFVDVPSTSFTTAAVDFDFKNATRINTVENHYSIPLGYPRGVIVYRVRGIGTNTTSFTGRTEGAWSFGFTSSTIPNTFLVPSTARYDFDGLDPHFNWQYSVSYAEDGKRKEVIGYFDGSLHNRQSVTKLNSDDNVIIAETKYDYEGRPAVQVIPTPLASTGIHYYSKFNNGFDRTGFDTDTKVNAPDPLGSSDGANIYYSASNPGQSGFNIYIPDANGYAYSRTRYKTDGTGRLRTQSSVGPDHAMGSGHETKYFYGSPTDQDELDRLFGNEVGNVLHYQKNMVQDANGQVSISYLDQEGRTIATCLAGETPSNLLPIDNRPDPETVTANLLRGKNHLDENQQMISTTTFLASTAGTHTFEYTLGVDDYCNDCMPTGNTCRDCKYDLQISIRDEDGIIVPVTVSSSSCPASVGNPITCTGISSGTYNFTAVLPVGSYTVTKILWLNEESVDQYREEFIEAQNHQHNCVEVPRLAPESCDFSCETMCRKQYTYTKEDMTTGYMNENGEDISSVDGEALIAQCETDNCGKKADIMDECSVKYSIMLNDMSPGGQYFDNMPDAYVVTTEGDLIQNSTYDINGWLDANAQSATMLSDINSLAPGHSFVDWDDVRANWDPAFASVLVAYHPEYCAYEHFCLAPVCTDRGTDMDDVNDYDESMFSISDNSTASTNGYLNPAGNTTSSTASSSSVTAGNSTYCPYSSTTLDPYFGCDIDLPACSTTVKARMQEMLSKFYPVPGTTPQAYYSIWYVMDDPNNIHLGGSGAATSVEDFFQSLHGDGTNPGLIISSAGGQITKYEYFRSAYLFYKKLLIYKTYPGSLTDCPELMTETGGGPDHFQARWPKNPLFAAIDVCTVDPSSQVTSIQTATESGMEDYCQQNCEGFADQWIAQLSSCGLTTTQEAGIREYLVKVCAANCDYSNTDGTTGCTSCPAVQYGTTSTYFHTFDDVVDYFTGGTCTVSIVHPPVYNGGSCSCDNLQDFITNHGLTSASDADIAEELNIILEPTTAFTATDVYNWKQECLATTPSNSTLTTESFPSQLLCPDDEKVTAAYNESTCSCENLHNFINAFNLDPEGTNDPYDTLFTQLVADMLSSAMGVTSTSPFTSSQVQAWLLECSSASPSLTDLTSNGFPDMFKCPVPASTSEEDIGQAKDQANCIHDALLLAFANSATEYNRLLEQAAELYESSYRAACLGSLPGRETFTDTYERDEYLYTLYYYDQAGNLVKTVPPEGVVFLDATDITETQNYRIDPHHHTFTSNDHMMVTRYKYNSLQQMIESETPDGGLTYYWYDELGRLVVSQNAKQRVMDQPPYNQTAPGYSYTEFDELGRVTEVGELYSSTPMDYATSRGRNTSLSLESWRTAGSKHEVTRTTYDEAYSSTVSGYFGTAGQENLRNRVTTTSYDHDGNGTYENASHYSYDIHGNVKSLIQENVDNNLATIGQSRKRIDYEYDLVSGNVNEVHYQDGYDDQFHHRYWYDADNRIVEAFTSRDRETWEHDAKYFYYPHGPLARTEIGDKQVQGTDYAYTLHGWIKGVNSNVLSPNYDMGKDSRSSSANLNKNFASDAMGYTLGYYTGDYSAIDATAGNTFMASEPATGTNVYKQAIYDLFNGNISRMVTGFYDNTQTLVTPQGTAYRYDQLNRIKQLDAFQDADLVSANTWEGGSNATTNVGGNYHEEYTYDFNGNISTLKRYGNKAGALKLMDDLSYSYFREPLSWNNKLLGVNDNAAAGNYDNDLDDMGLIQGNLSSTWNYNYDEIGNLVLDKQEYIDNIEWTVSGKVKKVIKKKTLKQKDVDRDGVVDAEDDLNTDGIADEIVLQDLEFVYDATGNRICKIVKPHLRSTDTGFPGLTSQDHWTYTYYVRDAQGSVMATYNRSFTHGTGSNYTDLFDLSELDIYGSSRVGMVKDADVSLSRAFTASIGTDNLFSSVSYASVTPPISCTTCPRSYSRTLGHKQYELSNHLGNVIATVSDRKLMVQHATTLTLVDHYIPDVLSANDYYAFGLNMPGRSFSGNGYRYGFNGKESDSEWDGGGNMYDYGFRIYNPRLGKFLSVDPLTKEYPWYTPYQFAGNKPIANIDLDGAEEKNATQGAQELPNGGTTTAVDETTAGYRPPSLIEHSFTSNITDGKPAKILDLSPLEVSRYEYGDSWGWNTVYFIDNVIVGAWNGTLSLTETVVNGERTCYNVKNYAVSSYNYHTTTPGSQQWSDFKLELSNTFTNVQTYENMAGGLLFGGLGTASYFGIASKVNFASFSLDEFLATGKTFEQYKAMRGGTRTLAQIQTSTGIQRISIEYHHVFITQRVQRAYNLPNIMVNNRINVWKVNTIQHALLDPYRYKFLRSGIKPDVGWFGKYNWFTKFE